MLKIDERSFSYLYSLKNMMRYNTTMTIKQESVAEHSFFVALFTLIISTERGLSSEEILKNLVIALCHDLPELEISDIPHNVKENMPELKNKILEMEKKWYEENIDDSIKAIVDNNFELNSIVEMADVLSVLQFCSNEENIGNNSYNIRQIESDAKRRCNALMEEIKNAKE